MAYQDGKGVPADVAEATNWYRKASSLGSSEAEYMLGLLYLNGRGSAKNELEAGKHFKAAAVKGLPDAELMMGDLTVNRQGRAAVDWPAASFWWRKAAVQGNAPAQCKLGALLLDGDVKTGVPKNSTEGLQWIRKGADQSDPSCLWHLGTYYKEGKGVGKDPIRGALLFKKAAGLGNALGSVDLAEMYEKGNGVPRDPVAACKWYLIAELQAPSSFRKSRIERVRRSLTAEQFSEAERLAAEFQKIRQ
jgi:TPR repeat protein